MKEKALKLADGIEESGQIMIEVQVTGGEEIIEAANMIRRLVEELDKQGEPVAWMSSIEWRKNHLMSKAQYESCASKNKVDFDIPLYTTPQIKPLSDEEIINIWEKTNYESKYYEASNNFAIEFARAIELKHGIK